MRLAALAVGEVKSKLILKLSNDLQAFNFRIWIVEGFLLINASSLAHIHNHV